MKQWLVLLAILVTACNGEAPETGGGMPDRIAVPPDTIVAADSAEHRDALNAFTFAVRLRSTTTPGVYDVLVHDGPKEAAGQFTLPRGAETFPVRLRLAAGPAFIVGFMTPDDTSFLPYYRVAATRQTIEMQYTHAYSFQ